MKTKIFTTTIVLIMCISGWANNENAQSSFKFIPKVPSEIFIGRIIDATTLNKEQYQYMTSPFESVTISFSNNAKSVSIKPTREAMMAAVKAAFKAPTNIGLGMSMRTLNSYDELQLLFGQDLSVAKLLGKAEDWHKTHQTLALFDFSQVFLSLSMDMPDSPSGDATNNQIYVNSIGFGRHIIALVESDFAEADVKSAISAALEADTKTVDAKTAAILANSIVHIVNISDGKELSADPINPFTTVAAYMKAIPTIDNFGQVVTFSAAYLKDNSMFVNKY